MSYRQEPEIAKKFREAGLLKRINDEILKPAGFVMLFDYDDDPNVFGPYQVRIAEYKLDKPKKPKKKTTEPDTEKS